MRLSSNSLVSFLGFPQLQLLIACICKLEAIKNGKPSKSGGRYLRFGGGGEGHWWWCVHKYSQTRGGYICTVVYLRDTTVLKFIFGLDATRIPARVLLEPARHVMWQSITGSSRQFEGGALKGKSLPRQAYAPGAPHPYPRFHRLCPVTKLSLSLVVSLSFQILISSEHWKVQTNTMKAYQKIGQYIYRHCQLSQVTPSHALLMDVCIRMQPVLELAIEPLQLTAAYYSKFIRVIGVVVILLLLMSGDIESNPGPHGEFTFLMYLTTMSKCVENWTPHYIASR